MKVLAICLDAAEATIVDQMVADGDLPNLEAFRDRGTTFDLRRPSTYRAELAHIPLLTGAAPEQLDYWGPNLFDARSYECSVRGTYLGAPFYSGRGIRSVVFDVPQMPLATDVDGVQVSAWGAHSPMFPPTSSPAGLYDDVVRRFGPHPAARSDSQISWYNERLMRDLADALVEGAATRARIVRWLLDENPDCELFLTAWGETHSAGHHYFHGVDPTHPLHSIPSAPLARELFRRVYRAVDTAIGEVIETLDDDVRVVTFAAHGMENNLGDVPALVLLPELLFRRHSGRPLIRLEDTSGAEAMDDDWLRLPPHRHVMEYLRARVDARLLAGAEPSLPGRVVTYLKHRLPPRAVSAARQAKGLVQDRSLPTVWHRVDRRPFDERSMTPGTTEGDIVPAGSLARWYRPFWPEMEFFALPSFSDAHLRVNVQGREGSGIVPPERFGEACRELAAELRRITDPRTGDPVVDEIVMLRGDDAFAMPALDADLIVSFRSVTDRIEHPDVGIVGPSPYMRTGEHSSLGWASIAGPGIDPEPRGTGQVEDLTRTILSLLGHDDDGLRGSPLLRPEAALR